MGSYAIRWNPIQSIQSRNPYDECHRGLQIILAALLNRPRQIIHAARMIWRQPG